MNRVPLRAALVASLIALQAAAADDPPIVEDFEKWESGPVPEALMVIEGEWAVVAETPQNKVLELRAEPVVDGIVLVGPSLKESAAVRAHIKGAKSRRAFPRLGVGLFGVSGIKARVVPAQRKVELLVGDDVVAEAAFDSWTEDAWWVVELKVVETRGSWSAEARVWKAGGQAPATPTIRTSLDSAPGQGRASLLGSPYANKPIHFDEVRVGSGKGE
ncbi:MAG: hypothetical protein ACKV19_02440 [Verrucomicrobiales bacterium]